MGDTPDRSPGLAILVKFPESQWSGAHSDSSSEAADALLRLALPAVEEDTMPDGAFWSLERTKFTLGHSPLVCFLKECSLIISSERDPEGMH